MTTQKFSKKEALQFGWKTMKNNLWFFIGLLIVAVLITFVPSIISELIRERALALSIIIDIATWVLQLVIGMGLIRIALTFCDNEKGRFSDLFSQYRLFFKYLFGSILYTLIVLGGLILLIIPGIYFGIRFCFYHYFIVDKKVGVIESLKRSWRITEGSVWNLFLFNLLLVIINLLGVLCLLVGLFATIPVTMMATAFVYRKLLAQIETIQAREH